MWLLLLLGSIFICSVIVAVLLRLCLYLCWSFRVALCVCVSLVARFAVVLYVRCLLSAVMYCLCCMCCVCCVSLLLN